jgi:hypothetical protein
MGATKPSYPELQRGHPLANGLLVAWEFYEGSGTILHDVSGRNNNATLVNYSFTSSNGWDTIGNSGGYPINTNGGSSNYFEVASTANLQVSNKLTLSFWYNRVAATYVSIGRYVAPNEIAYMLQIQNNNSIYMELSGDGTTQPFFQSTSTTTSTGWHNITGVYDGVAGTIVVYLDGNNVAGSITGSVPSSLFNTTAALGNRYSINGVFTYTTGIQDSVKLYNRALSASNVSQLYADPFCMYKPRMKASLFGKSKRLRNLLGVGL